MAPAVHFGIAGWSYPDWEGCVTDMSGTTPTGVLDLTATNLEAAMHLQVQAARFTTPVSFC